MILILTALAAFIGTFALGWHLRLFGCHRRDREDVE